MPRPLIRPVFEPPTRRDIFERVLRFYDKAGVRYEMPEDELFFRRSVVPYLSAGCEKWNVEKPGWLKTFEEENARGYVDSPILREALLRAQKASRRAP